MIDQKAIAAAEKRFESLQRRYTTTHNGKQCEFVKTALACMRECAERRENKPLTLDELKRMVGKPVYIVDDDEPSNTGWTIWEQDHVECWLDVPGNGECCGTIWCAYNYEPEGSDT